jgi:hypothetical protein
MENMYKLNLHDSIKFSESGLYILRVPGGWIYLQDRANSMGTDLMCFVPFNNEFQESELIAPPEQPNNGMELTSAPQSAVCTYHKKPGYPCPLPREYECGEKPCQLPLTMCKLSSGVGA